MVSPTPGSSPRVPLAFLLDVDNTLLDNDKVKRDMVTGVARLVDPEQGKRFWQLYEEVRQERGFVDFPLTVKRLAEEYHDPQRGTNLDQYLQDWPFHEYVYPHVFDTIRYLKGLGRVAIVSDGDQVFQPRKIRESGLYDAVDGNVLILVHKEEELPRVFERFPADHYCLIDDKARILSALERHCPTEFTTVLVMQGKYARPEDYSPRPDYIVPTIADVRELSASDLSGGR